MAAVPTRGNLIIAKNTLRLSKTGYELLDKKRNILIREMMQLIETTKELQSRIDDTFKAAYAALQRANIELGIDKVEKIALSVKTEDSVTVKFRSVMGVEIPIVIMEERPARPNFSLTGTAVSLDEAIKSFNDVKRMTRALAQIENSVYRLADSIKKTQKRANALKNIMIPRYEEETRFISAALEEKEREEFSRLKVIKSIKERTTEINKE